MINRDSFISIKTISKSVLSNLHQIADFHTDKVAFQFEDMITDMERKLLGKQK